MSLSDMQVFNEYFMPAIYDTIAQRIEAFNAASNGAIQLVNAGNVGDFIQSSFYDSLVGSRRRVDRYAANGAVATTDLSQTEMVAVKVAGGFGPVGLEPSQLTWLRKPTAEGVEMISRQFSDAVMQDQLNTAILALVTAIENQATATNDVSGGASITQRVINGAHKLFGDQSQNLVATVMTGAMAHDLIDNNLTNTEELFKAENVTVLNILGKPVIVTDAPSLTTVDPFDKVLSLANGAAVIRDPSDPIVNIDSRNGTERIATTWQADYDFTVSLKGYSWDIASGGASPTDADLGTGANWDLAVGDIKNSAGVIAIGDQV